MSKPKSLSYYDKKLREMITERKGSVPTYLSAQIELTAKNWRMLDKIDDEIYNIPMISVTEGSKGQQKTEMNPLLAMYDKLSRTLKLQYGALGLNYDSTPSKVDVTKPGEAEAGDVMAEFFSGINNK